MKQNNKVDITYLKTRALTRSISSDSHSIAERLWWLLYNSWTCPAPRSVTHVNSNHIIVLTDSHTTVTHHSPTRPDTRLYLKRKVIYHTWTNAFGQKFPHAERRVENATSSGNWRYLVKWLNTVFSVWCIFFTESKTKEKQGAGLNTSYPVSCNNAEPEIYKDTSESLTGICPQKLYLTNKPSGKQWPQTRLRSKKLTKTFAPIYSVISMVDRL